MAMSLEPRALLESKSRSWMWRATMNSHSAHRVYEAADGVKEGGCVAGLNTQLLQAFVAHCYMSSIGYRLDEPNATI